MKLSEIAEKKYANLKKQLWDGKITTKELLEEVKTLYQDDVEYQMGILVAKGMTKEDALRKIYNLNKKEVSDNVNE